MPPLVAPAGERRVRATALRISSASAAATIRAAHRQHVGVVVLARHPRGVEVVAERGADAEHLVGGNLLALAAAADHDAAVGAAVRDLRARRRRRSADSRPAASLWVPRSSTAWPSRFSVADQVLLQREARMVGADRDAHRMRLYRPCHAGRGAPEQFADYRSLECDPRTRTRNPNPELRTPNPRTTEPGTRNPEPQSSTVTISQRGEERSRTGHPVDLQVRRRRRSRRPAEIR